MPTVDELLFQINADTSQMRRQMEEMQRRLDQTTNQGRRAFQRLSTAARAAGAAILAAFSLAAVRQISQITQGALASASAIADQAEVVGLTAEAFQEYRFAAASAGVEQRVVDLGLQRFARRVAEAAQGGGELEETLRQYGIAVRDSNGALRTQEEVLADFADAVQSAGTEQEQLRLAFKAFDSEGARLVNLFRQGSEGIEDLRQEARDLGAILDDDLVQKAADLETRLGQLETAMKTAFQAGLLEGVTAEFGTFEDFLRSMVPVARDVGTAIGELVETVAVMAEVIGPAFQLLLRLLRETFNAINNIIGAVREFFGDARAAEGGAEALATAMAAIRDEAAGAAGAVRDLTAATREQAIEAARVQAERAAAIADEATQAQIDIFNRAVEAGVFEDFERARQARRELRREYEAGRLSIEDLEAALADLSASESEAVRAAIGDFERLRARGDQAGREVQRYRDLIERLSRSSDGEAPTDNDPSRFVLDPIDDDGGSASEQVSALERALQAVADRAAQARLQLSQLGESAGEVERLRTEAELLAAAQEDGLPLTAELRNMIDQTAVASGAAAQRLADYTAAALLIEAARAPQQAYTAEVERLTALLPLLIQMTGSQEAAQQVLNAALEDTAERYLEIDDAARTAGEVGREAFRSVASALFEARQEGETFLDVLLRIAEQLANTVLQRAIFDPIGDAIGDELEDLFDDLFDTDSGDSGGLLGVLGDLFGFARGGVMTTRGPLPLNRYAGGGVAHTPQLALFGEGRRPEAYVPLPDGRSIPVSFTSGAGVAAGTMGGVSIYYHIDARGADSSVIGKLERALTALDRSVEPRAVQATKNAADKYGDYAKAVGRRRA